jgi:hypothetical protein
MVICGQPFSAEVLERIAATVAEEPSISRRALSRRVCEWLEWRDVQGRYKQMSCRVALQKLAQRGVLKLPAVSDGRRVCRSARVPPSPQIAPFEGSLAQLGRIELRRVTSRHSAAHRCWRSLLHHAHYLGAGGLCGAQLRYLIHSEHQGVVGALAFSAAAWRVAARDAAIGWSEAARVAQLPRVVNNSRLLIAPQIRVPHLASHVLGLAARILPADWQARYGYTPLLLETFVERERFAGTCYRAANWQPVGHSGGRGRQDAHRQAHVPVKDIYLYPLCPQWRERLCEVPPAAQPQARVAAPDWAAQEFGAAALGDARLRQRLLTMARDFYAQPQAQIPQACGTRAKTKAAYRFFDHPNTTMDAILQPHYQATAERIAQHPVVLAVQDTTSLNYNAQPAIENLGPIGSWRDGPIGLIVHDTLAFTPSGTPLGVVDVQVWARDPAQFGKKALRHQLPIEEKESYKWLKSVRAVAALQARCPATTVVSVADREADLFELFDDARALNTPPQLLIRAERNRTLTQEHGTLWEHLASQPIAGVQQLQLPRRGTRAARVAELSISYAPVELKSPQRHAKRPPIRLWAVFARELQPPAGVKPLEWMLLSTAAVNDLEQALERLAWYAARWGIEVYHRTLKSGCQIEQRQLGSADRIEACLAIDMVVAWRILHLTKLGRDTPGVPCTVYFAEAEWKALITYVQRNANLPPQPPTLRDAIRLVASLGGFLGRKGDGEPGTQTLWLGLQRLDDMTAMYKILIATLARAPPTVSSGQT